MTYGAYLDYGYFIIIIDEPHQVKEDQVGAAQAVPPCSSATYSDCSMDIGDIDLESFRQKATDEEKLKLIRNRFVPEKSWVAPLHTIGQKKRRISDEYFNAEKYPTLRYSKNRDGLYCIACVLFSTDGASDGQQLRRQPLRDWSNSRKIISKHMSTQAHLNAQKRLTEFISVCSDEQPTILSRIRKAEAAQIAENNLVLKAVVEAVVLCGKQNIALRGHTDATSNIMAILNYRAKSDPILRKHLQSGPRNAAYTSHRIQNELIELCAGQIRDKILERCKEAKWFALLADETADISCTEQVSLSLRYVDKSDGKFKVREDFLWFAATRDTTGRTLADLIIKQLADWGLSLEDLVAQGYDGAGNMSGKDRGVQALIRELSPTAAYVHCKNHCLNLVIVHATKIPDVRNMLNTLEELVHFIAASPQRLECYLSCSEDKQRLKKFCETRWSQHDKCLSSLLAKYGHVIATLDLIQQVRDPKARSTAASLTKSLDSFGFLITAVVCQKLLQFLTPLSNALQAPALDLVVASHHAAELKGVLQTKRATDEHFNSLWASGLATTNSNGITLSVPRTVQCQQHRSNTPATSPPDYWRLNVYIPFIDHIISELDDRLCAPLPRLKAQYLVPSRLHQLTDEIWEEIKTEYAPMWPDTDNADAELAVWRHTARSIQTDDLCQLLENTELMFPNLHCTFKVLLTMPVSTATAERSFSSLRRLKIYLRSTMTETRLSSLALLCIHHDADVDVKKVVTAFDATGDRRIQLRETS